MQRCKDISTSEIKSLCKKNEEDHFTPNNIKKTLAFNRFDFYKEVFSDFEKDGFLMTYPHGKVIRQAQSRYYYRGEPQIFNSSQASLYRRLNNIIKKEESLVEEFVAYMKIADFYDLLLKFRHTNYFLTLPLKFNRISLSPGIDLLYEQLAQHYGFETVWLDMTSDFEIALFFSCCRFNTNLKKWEPLNNIDFNARYEAQFGVIFKKATFPDNHIPLNLKPVNIFPVGFQPFMRCHMQYSYVALMDKTYSLQKDNSIEILKFKHSEELSNFIFEKMNCGEKIYPQEGLNLMTGEIDEIKKRKRFTINTFEYVCGEKKFRLLDNMELLKLLNEYGYEIVNASNYFPKDKIEKVDKLYDNFDVEKTYNIKLRTRLTC